MTDDPSDAGVKTPIMRKVSWQRLIGLLKPVSQQLAEAATLRDLENDRDIVRGKRKGGKR